MVDPSDATSAELAKPAKPRGYPMWAPRFWHGMLVSDWLRLLARNRFRVHPMRLGLVGTISLVTVFNSTMRLLQQAICARRVAHTKIDRPPVFIVGHWRSGTTYLHELLSLDERFASPSTYQCFAAHHFLVTDWLVPRLTWFIVPSLRPMDNVAFGWQQPQEDEFALFTLGALSPYLRMAFPNSSQEYLEYLDLERLSDAELERWKQTFLEFLRRMTFHRGKRLILKSPTHTARIRLLAEMLPGARFVHITRDPQALIASTIRLWQSLDDAHGLQVPRHKDTEGYVFRVFDRLYGAFEKQRRSIDPRQICDVRYEDLVRDPVNEMERIYDELELGDFDTVRTHLVDFAQRKSDYRTNRHELPPRLESMVNQRCAEYMRAYGYEPSTSAPPEVASASSSATAE